jgi:hypothetical protein
MADETCDNLKLNQERSQTYGMYLKTTLIDGEVYAEVTFKNCMEHDVYLSMEAMQVVQPINTPYLNLNNLDSSEFIYANIPRNTTFQNGDRLEDNRPDTQILLKKGEYFTVFQNLHKLYDLEEDTNYRLHYWSNAYKPKNGKPSMIQLISNVVKFKIPKIDE